MYVQMIYSRVYAMVQGVIIEKVFTVGGVHYRRPHYDRDRNGV